MDSLLEIPGETRVASLPPNPSSPLLTRVKVQCWLGPPCHGQLKKTPPPGTLTLPLTLPLTLGGHLAFLEGGEFLEFLQIESRLRRNRGFMVTTVRAWLSGILAVVVVGTGCGEVVAGEGGPPAGADPLGHQVQELVSVDAVAGSPWFAECAASQQNHAQHCSLMAHHTCRSRGYVSGWFRGDMAMHPDGLHLGVDCVTTPVTELDAVPGDPGYTACKDSNLTNARMCAVLAHDTCQKRGYYSGWFRGDAAWYSDGLHMGLVCATHAVGVMDVLPGAAFYNECKNSDGANIQYCNLMANRTCTAAGYTSGFYRGQQAMYSDGLHYGATCLELRNNLPPNQPPGVCGPQQGSGSDAAFSRDYNLYKNAGTFSFRRNANTIKDRFVVTHQGNLLYDSGCIAGNATVNLSYSGTSSYVNVTVYPNCEGTTGTAWDFTVGCP